MKNLLSFTRPYCEFSLGQRKRLTEVLGDMPVDVVLRRDEGVFPVILVHKWGQRWISLSPVAGEAEECKMVVNDDSRVSYCDGRQLVYRPKDSNGKRYVFEFKTKLTDIRDIWV